MRTHTAGHRCIVNQCSHCASHLSSLQKAVLVLAILLAAVPPGLAAADEVSIDLTFAKALSIAAKNSPGLKRAEIEILQGRLRKEIAEYEDDLRISTQAALGRKYNKNPASANADKAVDEQSYGLSVNIPLYDFGRQAARERQLALEAEASGLGKAESADQLTWQLARAWIAATAAGDTRPLLEDQVQIASARMREQNRNYRDGLRPESDVVTAQVDLGRAQLAAERAVDEDLVSSYRLAAVMGLRDVRGVRWKLPSDPVGGKDPGELLQAASSWKGDRQPVSQKRRQLLKEALSAEIDAINARKRPVIVGSLSATEAGSPGPLYPQYAAQIQLNWDIPWSGQRRKEAELVVGRQRDLELQDEADELQLVGRYQAAFHELSASKRHWDMLKNQLKLVERHFRLTDNRYQTGKASALELSTAEAALAGVRLEIIKVRTEAAAALVDTAEALGIADLDSIFK